MCSCTDGGYGRACMRKAACGMRCPVIVVRRILLLYKSVRAGRRQGAAVPHCRALAAGIETQIGNHSFPATGITTYLKNGDTLENAAAIANHSSTRTTQLYDRRREHMSLAEVERARI